MKFRDLFKQTTYNILLAIMILSLSGLIYINNWMRKIVIEDEQRNAWQILEQVIKKVNYVLDKNETLCMDFSRFALQLKKDSLFFNKVLTEYLQNNAELNASFIGFFDDSSRTTHDYFIQPQKAIFNQYISDAKQKFLYDSFIKNNMKSHWDNPEISFTENRSSMNLFVPISDSSVHLKGFTGVNMNFDWMDAVLASAIEYFSDDPFAFIFVMAPDGFAIHVAGNIIEKNQNLINAAQIANDDNLSSLLLKMRNDETECTILKSNLIGTKNTILYKSLKNKKLSIALSYHENKSLISWNKLFIASIISLFFFFTIITLWLWWYWKKRAEMFNSISVSLKEIENGSTSALLPSSSFHHDLQELCLSINSMQRGLDTHNKMTISNVQSAERSASERKIAHRIRRYFYNPAFQFYAELHSKKIDQAIEADYLTNISGDFHDYFTLSPYHICFIIGTVSRPKKAISNIQTSIDILMTMNLIHVHIKSHKSLNQCIFELNNELIFQNSKRFTVNLFVGVFNCMTGELDFINAGMPMPYIISQRNIVSFSTKHGLPLASIENEEYSNGHKVLSNGDMLLAYSSGVLSRVNSHNEKYGQYQLEQIIATTQMMNPKLFLEKIAENIADFTEGQPDQIDDYTLIAIKYEDKQ